MDNDLMARRLRPPSQPNRSTNGHAPIAEDDWDAVSTPADQDAWVVTQPNATDQLLDADVPADFESNPAVQWPPAASTPQPEATHSPIPSDWPAIPPPVAPTPPVDPTPTSDAPWDRPAEAEVTRDVRVPERPSWDRPRAELHDHQDYADWTTEVPEDYPGAAPPWAEPTAPTRRPSAPQPASDPYDAMAPVVSDVAQPAPSPSWPTWSGKLPDPDVAQAPASFAEREVGPTPPADLFRAPDWPLEPVVESQSAGLTALPALPSPQTNVVVRIELALVDAGQRLAPVDVARRVGPAVEQPAVEAPENDGLTARHPAFEPRNHVVPDPRSERAPEYQPSAPLADQQPPWQQPQPTQMAAAPAPRVDLPWQLPALQAVEPAYEAPRQPEPQPNWVAAEQSWNAQPPIVQPAAPSPAAPPPQPVHAQPTSFGYDPLAALPAAAFAPAPVAQPAFVQPAAFVQPTAVVQSAPAAAQGDLWFLASEPAPATEFESAPIVETGEPSSLLTAGLTIGFALLVIVLVLVFIQLMTSLLG